VFSISLLDEVVLEFLELGRQLLVLLVFSRVLLLELCGFVFYAFQLLPKFLFSLSLCLDSCLEDVKFLEEQFELVVLL
jgi:hypothetical protein